MKIEEIPLDSPRLEDFTHLPWRLYRHDPCWTPPLKGELLGSRLLGLNGLLRRSHPYHRHADVIHFLAWKNGEPAGRISAAINKRYNEHHSCRIGFFGFFEVIHDYEVASALLDRACVWVKDRGMTVLRGPGEYSNAIHERQGILINGFEHPPTVELTHNPPFYSQFLERYGFGKAKDYHAYMLDLKTPTPHRLNHLAKQVKQHREIETRPINLKHLHYEVSMIVAIYNEAWSGNWGFLPITHEEAASLANFLRLIVDPGMARFAFVRGRPVGMLVACPDPYYALRPRWQWYGDSDFVRVARLLWKRRRIPLVRLMLFGVHPAFRKSGIDACLFSEVKDYAMQRGYQKCEASLLLEDNHLILGPSEFMGARNYKTWRIYDLKLE